MAGVAVDARRRAGGSLLILCCSSNGICGDTPRILQNRSSPALSPFSSHHSTLGFKPALVSMSTNAAVVGKRRLLSSLVLIESSSLIQAVDPGLRVFKFAALAVVVHVQQAGIVGL